MSETAGPNPESTEEAIRMLEAANLIMYFQLVQWTKMS